MPGASYPKADSERRNRNAPAFGWTDLPATSAVPVPDLPPGREWPSSTRAAWAELWTKPQASQWDPSGFTLHRWAWLHADLVLGKGAAGPLSGEMRQIEDRHGLSPKAMLQLRWRIVSDEDQEKPGPKPRPKSRARKLRVVDGKAS